MEGRLQWVEAWMPEGGSTLSVEDSSRTLAEGGVGGKRELEGDAWMRFKRRQSPDLAVWSWGRIQVN